MESIQLVQPNSTHLLQVTEQEQGSRLDMFITGRFPAYSRSFFQKIIESEHVSVNGRMVAKQGVSLKNNDVVSVFFPGEPKKTYHPIHTPLEVKVLFEHEHFLIIEKPAGLNVHRPATQSTEISLVDWLLHHYETIATVGYNDRPGIVHRLDKDTSGIMIIARTKYAHAYFARQFNERTITKTYLAVVQGHPQSTGEVDAAIARHPHNRKKMMAVTQTTSTRSLGTIRQAHSAYRVVDYFSQHSLVEVKPRTGRTHQIRVHLAHLGHHIVGDKLYGSASALINRQALHAHALAFSFGDQFYEFKSELPNDIKNLLEQAKKITR